MADYWTTPKVNWLSNDLIGLEDLNRVEQNISGNRDANFRGLQGFSLHVSNTLTGEDGSVEIQPGSGYSDQGYPIRMDSAHYKSLKTWEEGNGAAPGGGIFGGMAAAVTVAANTWYYIFVLMNPADGTTEIMIDDNTAGTNISHGTYTHKRLVSCVKTALAGDDGSFNVLEMYSTGNDFYLYENAVRHVSYNDPGAAYDSAYNTVTLTLNNGSAALPAIAVRANLTLRSDQLDCGFISRITGIMTPPAQMYNAGDHIGEYVYIFPLFSLAGTPQSLGTADFSIMIDDNGQIEIATYEPGGTINKHVDIYVRGFSWDRLQ